MNILKKLFGSKSNEAVSETGLTNAPSADDMNEQLFVDHQAPANFRTSGNAKLNPLAQFLEKGYASEGYRDGYTYHSGDILNAKIRSLMCEFRNVVDMQLETLRKDIQLQKEHRIEIEGLSGRMVKRLDLLIENQMQTIMQLEKEKENSSAEEGLVMKVVNEYREGYMRGLEDYQVEKMLGANSGMFN